MTQDTNEKQRTYNYDTRALAEELERQGAGISVETLKWLITHGKTQHQTIYFKPATFYLIKILKEEQHTSFNAIVNQAVEDLILTLKIGQDVPIKLSGVLLEVQRAIQRERSQRERGAYP